MKLKDKVAIVTGGAVNLGKCIALRLARDGADVALFAPEETELSETAEEIRKLGRRALPVVGNIRAPTQIADAVSRCRSELGEIDILVNNSGTAGPTSLVRDVTLDEWNDCLFINLTGAFLFSKAVATHMMERRRGKIICISSIAGRIGYPLRSPYCVAKWGVIGLAKTLAAELGEYKIQANAVLPGPVEGDRMKRVIEIRAQELGQSIEQVTETYHQKSALKKMVQPEDVAAMVAFLVSQEADNITGEAIDVSAGWGLA